MKSVMMVFGVLVLSLGSANAGQVSRVGLRGFLCGPQFLQAYQPHVAAHTEDRNGELVHIPSQNEQLELYTVACLAVLTNQVVEISADSVKNGMISRLVDIGLVRQLHTDVNTSFSSRSIGGAQAQAAQLAVRMEKELTRSIRDSVWDRNLVTTYSLDLDQVRCSGDTLSFRERVIINDPDGPGTYDLSKNHYISLGSALSRCAAAAQSLRRY